MIVQSIWEPKSFTLLDWMGDIKLILLLPFGLGAVLGFGLLSQKKQEKHLLKFTWFINSAVIVNISVMMFVPAGETLRGIFGRLTCIILLLWLIQEMAKNKWKTVGFDNGVLIFNGVPLKWVSCHAIYRIGLISLPLFDTFHYVLFEPLSIGGTYLYYRLNSRRHPLSYYFGYSDTLVAATIAVCSKFYPEEGFHLSKRYFPTQIDLDMIFVPVQCGVFVFCLISVIDNFTRRTLPKL